jgi:hypothetical protein
MLPDVVGMLLGMLPTIVTGAINLFFGLQTALVTLIPILLTTLLVDLLPALISTLGDLAPDLIGGSVQLWIGLAQGLISAAGPLAVAVATEIIPVLVGTLADLTPAWFDMGVEILRGLMVGLGDQSGALAAFLLAPMTDAVESVREILGIHSPSRTFEELAIEAAATLADDLGHGVLAAPDDSISELLRARPAPRTVTASRTSTAGDGLTADQEIHRADRELARLLGNL